MRNRRNPLRNIYLLSLGLALVLSSAMTLWMSRNMTPYRLESLDIRAAGPNDIRFERPGFSLYHDFDHDGYSERVQYGRGLSENHFFLLLQNHSLGVMNQLNYWDPIFHHNWLMFADYSGDGTDELCAFTRSGDSLFLYIDDIRNDERILDRAFLLKRQGKLLHDNWDVFVVPGGLLNADGDDSPEVVFATIAGHAVSPRSIYIFDVQEGKITRTFETQAMFRHLSLYDLTGDGNKEIIAAGWASGNVDAPARYGDDRCWLFVLDRRLKPVFEPLSFGEFSSTISCTPFKNVDQRYLFVPFYYRGEKNLPSAYYLIDSRGRIITRQETQQMPAMARAPLIDQNTFPPQFYMGIDNHRLGKLNERLEVVDDAETPYSRITPWKLIDLNADDEDEIICLSREYLAVYNQDLVLLADFPVSLMGTNQTILSYRRTGPRKPIELGLFSRAGIQRLCFEKNSLHALLPVFFGGGVVIFFALFSGGFGLGAGYLIRKKYLNVLLADSGRGILILNDRGFIQFANQQARKLLNISRTVIENRHFSDAFRAGPELTKIVSDSLRSDEKVERRISPAASSNERRIKVDVTPVRSPLSIIRRYLLTIEDPPASLSADRFKLWSKSVQKIAHDIKTPLSSVNINLSALQIRLEKILAGKVPEEDREALKDDLRTMRSELDRVHKMTRTFLKLTNLDKPAFQVVSIEDVVQAALQKFRSVLNQSVRIELDLEAESKEIWADPNQIELVFHILIENALDALRGKGMIRIGTSMAQYLANDFDKFLEIEVADSGPGIEPACREKLFDPYFTTKPDGTGMGLAIAKKIIEDHGGNIGLYSREGFGTVIRFAVPVNEGN